MNLISWPSDAWPVVLRISATTQSASQVLASGPTDGGQRQEALCLGHTAFMRSDTESRHITSGDINYFKE
jgi:hypothetical protein